MKTIVIGITLLAMVLIACTETRYSEPPHSSWKERDEYCFFFQVDARGSRNNNVGWSDTSPEIEATPAGYILTAVNARVSLYNNTTGRHGFADDDWFRADVLWATDADGLVNVHRRCTEEGDIPW